MLNHRPGCLPGPAPQVAEARARTQTACNAATRYHTGLAPLGTFWTKMQPHALYRIWVGKGARCLSRQLSWLLVKADGL